MRRERRRDRPVKRPTFRPEPLPGRPPWGTHWGIRCSLLLWLDKIELLLERLLPERNAEMVDVTAAEGREGDGGGGRGIPLDTGTGTRREVAWGRNPGTTGTARYIKSGSACSLCGTDEIAESCSRRCHLLGRFPLVVTCGLTTHFYGDPAVSGHSRAHRHGIGPLGCTPGQLP